jgi:hypothetical protein
LASINSRDTSRNRSHPELVSAVSVGIWETVQKEKSAMTLAEICAIIVNATLNEHFNTSLLLLVTCFECSVSLHMRLDIFVVSLVIAKAVLTNRQVPYLGRDNYPDP